MMSCLHPCLMESSSDLECLPTQLPRKAENRRLDEFTILFLPFDRRHEKAQKGMLEPEFWETAIGRAEVLTTPSISKVTIADAE